MQIYYILYIFNELFFGKSNDMSTYVKGLLLIIDFKKIYIYLLLFLL